MDINQLDGRCAGRARDDGLSWSSRSVHRPEASSQNVGEVASRSGGAGHGSSAPTGTGFVSAAHNRAVRGGDPSHGVMIEVPGHRPAWSPRVVEVALRFGLDTSSPPRRIATGLSPALRPGNVTLVQGPSGAGKSLFLEALARTWPASRLMQASLFPDDVAVIDAVAPTRGIEAAMAYLTACGLGEASLWMRRLDQLSEGEQFRARLARAISLHARAAAGQNGCGRRGRTGPAGEAPAVLLCDEFGTGLHTRAAQAMAFNLRKLASRERLALVLASSREDLEADLQPDVTIQLSGTSGTVPFQLRTGASGRLFTRPEPSFASTLRVERGSLKDFAALSAGHYRRRERVGFVDKVFALRDLEGETLGVAVYGHAGLELRPRNTATGGRFVKNAELLNSELRVLKRLVIHPDVRGCGLGARLVRESLPRVGVRFVECLATMGLVNPVFEKAGMERVGACELPKGQAELLDELRELNANPLAEEFEGDVESRPEVRTLVERAVGDWYGAMTGGGRERARRQSARVLAGTFRQLMGSQPVYYLWAADEAGRRLMEESLAGV